MSRRRFITLFVGSATAWTSLAAMAQQQTLPVIGYLSSGAQRLSSERLRMFLEGLNKAGYTEGKNISIEYCWAEEHYERLKPLAEILVKHNVSLIVVPDSVVTARAAQAATSTIPIVFGIGADPVKSGLVKSLNRPGGNLTGISRLNVELESKRLELLHEMLPKVRKFALLVNPDNPNAEPSSKDTGLAAHAMDIKLHILRARNDQEHDMVFEEIVRLGIGGLVIAPDPFFIARGARLGQLSLIHKVPTIFQYRQFVEAGGLVSYAGDMKEGYRLLGIYISRILKGGKPEDLPVQQYASLELVINLRTAKALDITIPEYLLVFADELIE